MSRHTARRPAHGVHATASLSRRPHRQAQKLRDAEPVLRLRHHPPEDRGGRQDRGDDLDVHGSDDTMSASVPFSTSDFSRSTPPTRGAFWERAPGAGRKRLFGRRARRLSRPGDDGVKSTPTSWGESRLVPGRHSPSRRCPPPSNQRPLIAEIAVNVVPPSPTQGRAKAALPRSAQRQRVPAQGCAACRGPATPASSRPRRDGETELVPGQHFPVDPDPADGRPAPMG